MIVFSERGFTDTLVTCHLEGKKKTQEGPEKNQGTDAKKNESKNKTDLAVEHAERNEGIEIGSEFEVRLVKHGSPAKVELNQDLRYSPGILLGP